MANLPRSTSISAGTLWTVSQYDFYEPVPSVRCPWCGAAVGVWLGNGGPCRLFVFRQGASKHLIDHPVDAEARIDPSRYSEFQLPPEFDLLGVCSSRHRVPALGRCRDGIWCDGYIGGRT